MARIRNVSSGLRGAWSGGVLINAEPGEVIEADDFAEEWFTAVASGPLDRDENGYDGGSLPHDPPALSGKTKAELIAIADAEGVDLDDGMTNAAIVAAIEAVRGE